MVQGTSNGTRQKRKGKNKIVITALVLLFLAAGIITALELTDRTFLFHERPPTTSAGQYTKGEPAPRPNLDSKDKDADNRQTQPGDNKNAGQGQISGTLQAPSGTFVSAHNVLLSSQLSSVCNTTPGATCKIQFTKGDTVKSLAVTPVDRGGTAYWDAWKPQDIGLSSGTWQVEAVATASGQTKTARDALELVIE